MKNLVVFKFLLFILLLAWGNLEWQKWKRQQQNEAERAELSRQGRGHASAFLDAVDAYVESMGEIDYNLEKTVQLTAIMEELKALDPEAYARITANQQPMELAQAIRSDSTVQLLAKIRDFDLRGLWEVNH
jgi:hypothetical protein